MPKCECSMAISMLGDGCSTCNHELYLECLQDDFNELLVHFKEAMRMLDNIRYWDTCPVDYEHRIINLLGEEAHYA